MMEVRYLKDKQTHSQFCWHSFDLSIVADYGCVAEVFSHVAGEDDWCRCEAKGYSATFHEDNYS